VVRYDGPAGGTDTAAALALDGNGYIYVTGASAGTGSGQDYATVQYDSAGQQQWAVRYDGPVSGEDLARALAVDASGNVYLSVGAQVVRLSTAGVRTVVAGTGTTGFSGDGGPAVQAQLGLPGALALDGRGDLYIADNAEWPGAARVRKVDRMGRISTVAGGGPAEPEFPYAGAVLAKKARFGGILDIAVDARGSLVILEAQHFLGGSVTIPEGIPVSKLETIVRIGAQEPKRLKVPELTDYRILAARYDPGWVAAVMFQALNDEPLLQFSSPKISAVIFDADGNVIGGGTGSASTPLPPLIRAQYDASSGLSAIPFDRAASAGVSVLGRYDRVT